MSDTPRTPQLTDAETEEIAILVHGYATTYYDWKRLVARIKADAYAAGLVDRAASTVHTDDGLRAQIEAACDLAEGEARHVVDDEVYVSVGLIRNAINASPAPTDNQDDVIERVIALADAADAEVAEMNSKPDPITGRHSTMQGFVLTADLRAVLAPTAPEGNHP